MESGGACCSFDWGKEWAVGRDVRRCSKIRPLLLLPEPNQIHFTNSSPPSTSTTRLVSLCLSAINGIHDPWSIQLLQSNRYEAETVTFRHQDTRYTETSLSI